MTFYVISVNGEVSTVAYLSDEDGQTLRRWAADRSGPLLRIQVIEQSRVATELEEVKAAVDLSIDSWR